MSAYEWLFNNTTIPNENNAQITAFSTGNYSLIVTDNNGCKDTSVAVTISASNSIQAIIISSSGLSACQGDSLLLTTNINLNSYQWSLNGVSLLGNTNNTLIVTQSGNYSVADSTNACNVASIPLAITFNQLPQSTISTISPTNVCNGDSVFINSGSLTNNYQWLLNNTTLAGATNPNIIATLAGNYSLIETNIAGCIDTSNIISVVVNIPLTPLITATNNNFTICEGDSILLNATVGLNNYQWLYNNTTLLNANTTFYYANQPGSYQVIASSNNGCQATSAPQNITVNTLPQANLTPSGNITLCIGTQAQLQVSPTQNQYQWYLTT